MVAKILIVESDLETGRLADFLLRRAGYGTLCAYDVEGGVAAALDGAFDVVLCGVDAPGDGGFMVIRRLQKEGRWRRAPVVALTRLSLPRVRDEMRRAGFSSYLQKPIEPEIFVSQVERLLPTRLRQPQPLAP